jgi:hypothetical protein
MQFCRGAACLLPHPEEFYPQISQINADYYNDDLKLLLSATKVIMPHQ